MDWDKTKTIGAEKKKKKDKKENRTRAEKHPELGLREHIWDSLLQRLSGSWGCCRPSGSVRLATGRKTADKRTSQSSEAAILKNTADTSRNILRR